MYYLFMYNGVMNITYITYTTLSYFIIPYLYLFKGLNGLTSTNAGIMGITRDDSKNGGLTKFNGGITGRYNLAQTYFSAKKCGYFFWM